MALLPLFGSRQFSPIDISFGDLAVWLDGAATPVGAVASWTDKSGKGNHATQGVGAQQPVCVAENINGLRALNFQTQALAIPDNAGLRPGNAGVTIFIITRNNSDSGTEINLFRKWGAAGNLGYLINYKNDGAPDSIVFGISDDGTAADYILPNQPSLLTTILIEYKGRASTSTNSEFFLNGTSAGTTTKNTFASTANIGVGEASTSNFDIGEILVYMRELSASDELRVKNYLIAKWGDLNVTPEVLLENGDSLLLETGDKLLLG